MTPLSSRLLLSGLLPAWGKRIFRVGEGKKEASENRALRGYQVPVELEYVSCLTINPRARIEKERRYHGIEKK